MDRLHEGVRCSNLLFVMPKQPPPRRPRKKAIKLPAKAEKAAELEKAVKAANTRNKFTAVWGPHLDHRGWTMVSNFFLENYHRLKPEITHSEAMFIIHVLQHKWTVDAPFPSYSTVCRRMGVSIKSARRYAVSLDEKKYLQRVKRVSKTNKFNFSLLFQALRDLDKTLKTKPRQQGKEEDETDD